MTSDTHTAGNDKIQAVARILAGIRDPQKIRRFMNEIMTPAEIHDLGLRWRLLQGLHAGASQRQIAGKLGVSLCKITRGSRILKQPGSVTAMILRKKRVKKSKGKQ